MQDNLKMIFEHDIDIWGGHLGIDNKNRYTLSEEFKSIKSPVESIS